MTAETGYSESTEEEHTHICGECGGVWSHNDESCVGPRYKGLYVTTWDCPACDVRG